MPPVTKGIVLANHGKSWDCKAMGTKVSEHVDDAMLARLLTE